MVIRRFDTKQGMASALAWGFAVVLTRLQISMDDAEAGPTAGRRGT